MAATEWHGTDRERRELETALEDNCTCEYDMAGLRTVTCPSHEAMVKDQRFLDGLLEMRQHRELLKGQEFKEKP